MDSTHFILIIDWTDGAAAAQARRRRRRRRSRKPIVIRQNMTADVVLTL